MESNWTKEKEKKIMRKYRFTLTFRVIRVVAAMLLLFFIYNMAANILINETGNSQKNIMLSKLAMDMTEPVLWIDSNGSTDVSSFLSQTTEMKVYRTVGEVAQTVGTLTINKPLISHYGYRNLEGIDGNEEETFNFYLPKHPTSGKVMNAETQTGTWKTLEKVHEGTVADLAFSTDRYYDPTELTQKLQEYNLHILWMPLYTGELKDFDSGYTLGGEDYLVVDGIGLKGGQEYDKNFRMSHGYSSLSTNNIKDSQSLMLKHMKYLLDNESKSYIERFLGLDELDTRYNYIKKNGFQAYGAVVTGPVKELLKLKEESFVRGAKVGEITYWNWDEYN